MTEFTMDRLRENLNIVDVLDHIFAEEAKSKRKRAYEKQIQMSGFPIKKTLDDFDFSYYNRFTVEGTAASRVFFRIMAKAVRMGEYWSDAFLQGLARPSESPSASLSFAAFDLCRQSRLVGSSAAPARRVRVIK